MIILVAPLLSGCTAYDFFLGGPLLRDIRVESAEITDQADHPETWFDQRIRPQQSLPSVLIVISTPQSLVEYSQRYGYSMRNEVSVCQEGIFSKTHSIRRDPYIFYTGGAMGIGGTGPGGPQRRDPDGRYRSYFFIDLPIPRDPSHHIGLGLPFYDLSKERNDLCFHVLGGTMIGTTHDSGSVLIPDALIKDALDRAAAAAAP